MKTFEGRKIKARWLAAVAVALAALLAWGAEDAAKSEPPLILLTTAEMPPYSYRDETTGEIVGEEIDIAREAAAARSRAWSLAR